MPSNHLKSGGWLRSTCALLLVLVLSACGPKASTTPTVSVQAIYTAAYQTLVAQQATQAALNPPTSTPPPPTQFPTLPPASPLPTLAFSFSSPTAGSVIGGGGAGACDSSAFVADVTIPDNSAIDPGKTFTKTWTLLNNGTCTWGTGYSLAFKSGDQMNGTTTAITNSVAPGSSINISVKLTAPSSSGTYKGIWQMQNASNQSFGDTPWVVIKVGAGATATAGPSPTALAVCSPNCTITITSNKPDFTVTISNNKAGNTECIVPANTTSCSFTVPPHWDGTVTLTKGKWTFDNSPYTFTDVTKSKTVDFPAH